MGWKQDFNYGLGAFGLKLPDSAQAIPLGAVFQQSPCGSTATVVGASALLFYALERGHNPKVKDMFDAMVYTSTCLSVGYGDIFAKTPLGKLLGSTLMTIGPALAAKALDGGTARAEGAFRAELLDTLRQIQAELTAKAPDGPQP